MENKSVSILDLTTVPEIDDIFTNGMTDLYQAISNDDMFTVINCAPDLSAAYYQMRGALLELQDDYNELLAHLEKSGENHEAA